MSVSQSPANLRAFVRRHTTPLEVPGVPSLMLRVTDDIMGLMRLAGGQLGDPDPPLPFWAFAWAGGLAVVQHLLAMPGIVAGRRVVDVGTGSGLCAIVAARLGAESVLAADVDPLAVAAATINAQANDVRIDVTGRDLLADEPPSCDVVLAGDVCYEERMASRMLDWLRLARAGGADVLIGDPGRRYLPSGLEPLATYRIPTSREIEDGTTKMATVYALAPWPTRAAPGPASGSPSAHGPRDASVNA